MQIQEVKDEEMIQIMIAQHGGLRAEVKDMHEWAIDVSVNAEQLHADMLTFRKTLEEHLALEDGVFYPRLLDKLGKKNIDTRDTREFIEKMKVIGDQVFAFLEAYNSIEAIRADQKEYLSALELISSLLLLRLSAEEDGVYLYWNI